MVTIDSIALHVLTYVQGKQKTIFCCYIYVRILRTGICIVHVQTRTLHDKKNPTIRESISLKWYPVMCPLSHPLIGNFTLTLEVFHKFHKLYSVQSLLSCTYLPSHLLRLPSTTQGIYIHRLLSQESNETLKISHTIWISHGTMHILVNFQN